MADEGTTIIIKKIKKGGHGHHGGAWKVAYADFVTAMMAFFLLLWLLNVTTKEQKEGIAEYFTPTIGLKDEMGIGFDGGATPLQEGTRKTELTPPGVVVARMEQGQVPDNPEQTLIESTEDSNLFEKAEKEMRQAIESDPNLREISENVVIEQTPEGLKIEVIDDDKYPMFEPGGTILTDFGQRILRKMAEVIKIMPNFISITGHTDASGFNKVDYSNWELSSDRANAARRFLVSTGMQKNRVKKVTGRAATELLLPEEPLSTRNRRITIILLRGSHLNLHESQNPTPRSLLSPPRASDKINQVRQSETPQAPLRNDPITPAEQDTQENYSPNSNTVYEPQLPNPGNDATSPLPPSLNIPFSPQRSFPAGKTFSDQPIEETQE